MRYLVEQISELIDAKVRLALFENGIEARSTDYRVVSRVQMDRYIREIEARIQRALRDMK